MGLGGHASADSPGWGAAVPLETGVPGNATWAHIAADSQGNAIAVWVQDYGNRSDIWANRFVNGPGWGSPIAIETGDDAVDTSPMVAVDARGHGIVVWDHCPPPPPWPCTGIYATRFDPITGWSLPTTLATWSVGQGSLYVEDLAIDGSGTAMVVWEDTNGAVWATRTAPGRSWEAPTLIGLGARPGLAVSPNGTAIVVWQGAGSYPSYRYPTILAKRFSPGLGWRTATPIALGVGFDFNAGSFAMVSDSSRTALVVISDHHGRINATRWVPGLGWSGLSQIGSGTGESGIAYGPAIAASMKGIAFAAWTWYDNPSPTSSIWASRYVASEGSPITVDVDRRTQALPLVSPADDVTTFDGTVEVSGTTEPGVTLIVNGFSAAVALDGSFSIRIGLPEGRNTIVAMATDAAGNVATASATVTYVNPFSQDLAALRLVAIAGTVGVVALASLFSVMYIARWGRERGGRHGSQDGSRMEEPEGVPSQATDDQKQANGGFFQRGLPVERRWPAKAASVPVRLTAKERILLHVLHFARYADALEVPRELTQERIVEAAGIDRRHFAQYVHPLVRDGLVRERMARVRGAVQRRRVYVATEEGRNRALGVRDRIRSAMVRIRDDSGIREVTVAEALLEARGSMSVLDILRESIETGVVDLTR